MRAEPGHSEKLWLEISAGALEHNLRALRDAATGDRPEATPVWPKGPGQTSPAHRAVPAMLAVIKADAYGHGATLCAPVLARAGAEWLGVTDAREGAAVREALTEAGIVADLQPEILVMCGLQPGDAARIVAHRLTPVAWSPEQLTWLEAACYEARVRGGEPNQASAEPLAVHLEIDTGMCRQGVQPGRALEEFLEHLQRYHHLHLGGVLTHFSSAEVAHSPVTEQQRRRFESALRQLAQHVQPKWLHAGNTATLAEHSPLPWLHGTATEMGSRLLCRTGLGLYGYALPVEGGPSTLGGMLRLAATWKTRVIGITEIDAGEHIGYNATFTAREPMRIALLPAGYADGLRRELSRGDTGGKDEAGGWVLIRGERAPIVGRVSMNLTTADVTHIATAALGDEVILLGPGIPADEHARLAGTIPYEILCAMRGSRELID